jgi:hypothetical protein
MKNTISQQFMGQSMTFDIDVRVELSTLVKEKNEEGYELEVRYTRVSTRATYPGGEMVLSSDDARSSGERALASVVDKPIQVKMDARGKVMEVTGLDALLDALAETNPESIQQIKSSFGEQALQQNFQSGMMMLPDYPVAKGESWTRVQEVNVMIPTKVANTYTFLGSEKGTWKIGCNSVIKMDGAATEANGMQMENNLGGTLAGEFAIDQKTGWVKTGSLTMSLNGENVLKANDRLPMDVKIPMEIESKTIVSGEIKK